MFSRYSILFSALFLVSFTNAEAVPIYFSGPVTLTADTTLTGSSITFAQTVDSDAGPRTLAVNSSAGGLTRFDGAVGSTAALASLVTNADGQTDINGGSVTTVGNQTYNDPIILTANTTLSGNNITFAQTVDSDAGPRMLVVNSSAGGLTRFDGAVGSTAALASLVTNADGQTDINGGSVTTVGDQTYNDVLTFSNDLILTGTNISLIGGIEIDIGGTLEAEYEQIFANGALFLDGLLDLTLTGGFDPIVGDTFDLLFGNSITDLGLTINAPILSGGKYFDFSIINGSNNDLLRVSVKAPASVPEPASLLLMSIGFVILGLFGGGLQRSRSTSGNSLA